MRMECPVTDDLLAFLTSTPSPYHVVAEARRRLSAAGFRELDERQDWESAPGLAGFVVRGGGSIVAFHIGSGPLAEQGCRVIGTHTDSPQLRLKPCFDQRSPAGVSLAVEPYGGGLWHTWLDRELSLAGRVVLKDGSVELIDFAAPVARIPSLAIHLNRDVNRKGLELNLQQHLCPLLTLPRSVDEANPLMEALVQLLASRRTTAVRADQILSFDLGLIDAQPPARAGLDQEFICSGRLDNLVSVHAGLSALLAATPGSATHVWVAYDHEEVGSRSAQGAQSTLLLDVLARLTCPGAQAPAQSLARCVASSLLLSADMAHGLHPNYVDRHDDKHRPILGGGPVLKQNANQSYATDAPSAAAFLLACERAQVVPQHFVTRNDIPCGSTVGPITAARLGMRAVDVGSPMLSMHSCRELAAVADVAPYLRVMRAFFELEQLPDPRC